jgi:PEGA domain
MMLDDAGLSMPVRSPTGARPATGARTGQRGPTTQSGPTPTTLSGAASETVNGDIPRKSRVPLFAALGGIVAVGGVVGVLALGGKKADTTTGSQVPPAVPDTTVVHKDETITVTVNSDPAGAKVTRADNNESGTTPYQIKVKKGSDSFDVLVKLDGYKPQPRTINTDRSYAVMVALEKIAEPTPPVQQAVNVPSPTEKTVTPAVEKPDKKDRHHRSSSSSKEKGDTATAEKGGEKSNPAGKSGKSGKDEGDDMKLLQPKF